MRKLSILGLSTVLVLGLLSTSTALAGWFWDDPAWQVEGVGEVDLRWGVDAPGDYASVVGLVHPKGVDVDLITKLGNKTHAYDVASPKLTATDAGVQLQGEFLVVPVNGASDVTVTACIEPVHVCATGAVGQRITVGPVVVPGPAATSVHED